MTQGELLTKLDETATKYAQNKKLPVQTKQAYIAGASMMYDIIVNEIKEGIKYD